MPRDAKLPFVDECRLYDAHVTLVDGLITDAGRMAGEQRQAARLVRRLDAEGAVSRRRQEDDGLRAGRAARLGAARLDRLSDRRRHRHGRHVEGLRRDGSARLDRRQAPEDGHRAADRLRADRPRVRRRAPSRPRCGSTPDTEAHGLRVPKAIGDFLVLRAIRESGGTAVAVTDRPDGRRHARHRPSRRHLGRAGRRRGAVGAPTAGRRRARCAATDTVVLFNTGGALKYLEVLHSRR